MPDFAVQAPVGWEWTLEPTATNTHGQVSIADYGVPSETRLINIDEWGAEHDYYIVSVDSVGMNVATVADVYSIPGYRRTEQDSAWPVNWCRHGEIHGRRGFTTPCTCGGVEETLHCVVCGNVEGGTCWEPTTNSYRCHNGRCANTCESRNTPEQREAAEHQTRYTFGYEAPSNARYCTNATPDIDNPFCEFHDNRVECPNCGDLHSPEYGYSTAASDEMVCESCFRMYCEYGEHFATTRVRVVMGSGTVCAEHTREANSERYEEYDEAQDEATPEMLLLAADPHRPIRTCSIEMETVDGGSTLALALHRAGLSNMERVQSYGSSNRFEDEFCHVERDSSLGEEGGELIFDRIRMDNDDDIRRMHSAMQVVRTLIKNGDLGMTMACGLHIHVDAHQMGVGHVRNLVLVTNYLEDIMYRLSAAKYLKHRGIRFAQPLPKGAYPDRRTFGVNFLTNNGHESALNVGHYWGAMRNRCRCGASIVGTHDECSCNLGKCTFEFRYFNGTANFRKVQAYAALCQSLVSYAKLVPDIEDGLLVPQSFIPDSAITETQTDGWDERLRWMLTNLFFSVPERESLMYVTSQSALSRLGNERIADIFTTEYLRTEAPAQVIEHRNPRGTPNSVDFPDEPYYNYDEQPEYDERDYDDEPSY